MKFSVSSVCRLGGRDYNQDSYSVCNEDGFGCFVVCDGLGSYSGSEVISKKAAGAVTDAFKNLFKKTPDTAFDRSQILKIFASTQENLLALKEGNPKLYASCTTIAAVFSDFERTLFAHIGDSRILFFHGGKLTYRTKDHSMAQIAVEQNLITDDEIRTHPDQNKLTRVLGSDYYIAPDLYTLDRSLKAGDALVICSDGFWEYVYDSDIEKALSECGDTASVLKQTEKLLLSRAPDCNDNYTALIIKVTE